MRPRSVVSLDTRIWTKKLQSSSSMVASVLKHLWSIPHNTTTRTLGSADIARARSRWTIISRWSPFGTCWVSTREPKREADGDLPVFSSRKRAKWRSVSCSFSSHHRISPLLGSLWLRQRYRIERRRRRARFHDALLWSKFVRHCLVGFYVI